MLFGQSRSPQRIVPTYSFSVLGVLYSDKRAKHFFTLLALRTARIEIALAKLLGEELIG